MSVRKTFAAAIQMLRARTGLSQQQVAKKVNQSHFSHLESGKSSATFGMALDLASDLNVRPLTLFAVALAANDRSTISEILEATIAEIELLGIGQVTPPFEPSQLAHPLVEESKKRWEAVQALKREGLNQSAIVSRLGLSKGTVSKLWHKTSE